MALGYLLSPVLQIENASGKPLVGGKIVVYNSGTTNVYITRKDFEGNLNPAEVLFDSNGMCVLIAESGKRYDVYCYDSNGVQQWSRESITIGDDGNSSSGIDDAPYNDMLYGRRNGEWKEIPQSLALGETSSTAYRGDRGKAAYDHSLLTSGNPHKVTKSDVGLGNVDNTSDANKPISTATQEALDGKVDKVSGKVLSSNDFTNTYKSNVDANTSARHTHSNKEILDATTASFTSDLKTKLDGIASGATAVSVDSALSSNSTNPVQNKVVKAALDGKQATMTAITDDEINALS